MVYVDPFESQSAKLGKTGMRRGCMTFDQEYQQVLQQISKWPPEQRASLAAEVLATLKHDRRDRRPTLSRALGLARTTSASPSDEDVKRLIEEHRDEKYGGDVH